MHKSPTFILVFLILILKSSLTWALNWTPLKDGLSYTQTQVIYAGLSQKIEAIKIDLKQFDVKPLWTKAKSPVKSMALSNDALAVINASFFDPSGKPLGLIVIDNEIKNPFKNISWWSVLCFKNQRVSIEHSPQYLPDQCDNALQAGPRLLINGAIPALKENISKKSALGVYSPNELVLVMTQNALPISLFAEILKAPEENGGFALKEALNLDGGSSSQLYLKTESFTLDLPSYISVPVGLGVFEKPKSL